MRKNWGKRLTVFLFLGLAAWVCLAVPAHAFQEEIIDGMRKGVVQILVKNGSGYSTGSGFGVGTAGEDTDIFVTNRHVVMDEDGENADIYIMLDNGGDMDEGGLVRCKALYVSEKEDLDYAVIKAQEPVKGFKAIPIQSAKATSVGTSVYAVGYPGLIDQLSLTGGGVDDSTVTQGIVSRHMKAQGDVQMLVHDAKIAPGNSGGPLLTKDGNAIGINTYAYGELAAYGASEYAGALYADYVMDTLDDLGIPYDTQYKTDFPWKICIGLAAALFLSGAAVLLYKKSTALAADKGFCLQGIAGVYAGQELYPGKRMQFGRNPSKNDCVYPGKTLGVSWVHCEIYRQGARAYIRDRGSTCGTFLNGRKLDGRPHPLEKGDCIWIGSQCQAFQVAGAEKKK